MIFAFRNNCIRRRRYWTTDNEVHSNSMDLVWGYFLAHVAIRSYCFSNVICCRFEQCFARANQNKHLHLGLVAAVKHLSWIKKLLNIIFRVEPAWRFTWIYSIYLTARWLTWRHWWIDSAGQLTRIELDRRLGRINPTRQTVTDRLDDLGELTWLNDLPEIYESSSLGSLQRFS